MFPALPIATSPLYKVTNFHYEEDRLAYETDGAGAITKKYAYDDKGMPLSVSTYQNGSFTTYYYTYNGQGDVAALVGSNGATVSSSAYDAWGNILDETSTVSTPFGYRGEFGYTYDRETGLYFLQSRYYDPTTGRFISKDRFKGFKERPASQHPYIYCENDPVDGVDPEGMARKHTKKNNRSASGAWKTTKKWNSAALQKYGAWVKGQIDFYNGKQVFQCKDLPITLIVDFASQNGLPVAFKTFEGDVIKSSDAKFKSKNDFLEYAKNHMYAMTVVLKNTTEIYPSKAGAGDIIGYVSYHPKPGNTGHTRVILTIQKRDKWIPEKMRFEKRYYITYAQGNNPSNLQYGPGYEGWLTGEPHGLNNPYSDLDHIGHYDPNLGRWVDDDDEYKGIRRWNFLPLPKPLP